MNLKNIYFIGGVSRSGKTILRNKILEKYKIEGISTDILFSIINKKHTSKEVKPELIYDKRAEFLWPYIESLSYYQSKYSQNGYVIEGDLLLPSLISNLSKDLPKKVIFLGISNLEIDKKIEETRKYSSENDYTLKMSDEQLKVHIQGSIKKSLVLKDQAKKLGYKYFDVSTDFLQQQANIIDFLID